MGFRDWLGWRRKEPPMPATLHCTFCGRSGLEAEKIIGMRRRTVVTPIPIARMQITDVV